MFVVYLTAWAALWLHMARSRSNHSLTMIGSIRGLVCAISLSRFSKSRPWTFWTRRSRNTAMISKKIVVFGAVAFILSGLFPPWITTFSPPGGGQQAQTRAGYHLIFNPPPRDSEGIFAGVQIDSTRLLVQWAIIGVILVGATVLRRKD